jgi:hypothetical protein
MLARWTTLDTRPRLRRGIARASLLVLIAALAFEVVAARNLAAKGGAAAAEVRVLELAGLDEKGDVSDWIAARERAGRSRDEIRRELEQLAAGAPTAEAAAAGRGHDSTF